MKERLDILVVDKGLAETREKAKALIMSGEIMVDGLVCDKAGTKFESDAAIEIKGSGLKYVSRGGLKLEKAIESFGINLTGLECIDIGASTGGFTDCMLQSGASKVYCVDVGYGQLAWNLRTDPRVVNYERTNFRHFDPELTPGGIDFFSIDVAFISLNLMLPKVREIAKENTSGVCLIKPQFEAGRELVGKNGVVRDPKVRYDVIEKCLGYAKDNGFYISGLTYSPIKGPKGNIEFLMYLTGDDRSNRVNIKDVVDESQRLLEGKEV